MMMMNKHLFITIYLLTSFFRINSLDLSLNCWRCEITIQSPDLSGAFLDDCQAQFDFTQHTQQKCDGKCWKSVDLIDKRTFNSSYSFFKSSSYAKLKSSRRCFSANELVRAAEMGVNTSDGCRQVMRNDRKLKEICFCSDQDMCNQTWKLISNELIVFILIIFYALLSR